MIACNSMIVLTSVILLLIQANFGNAFNLSPKPNFIFREPEIGFGISKVRSSYFGFTLSLKRNSVLVGAPRAQSTLDMQRGINETGAIYKCRFEQTINKTCVPFVFDSTGNNHEENKEFTFNKEKKDFQWLGASMDGTASDTDKFVVCAPRIISDQTQYLHYLMHGICYWTTNTTSIEPDSVQRLAPLRLRDKQQFKVLNNESYFYYIYGEQGISVHITENNDEILIGAPGVFGWKGSVINYKPRPVIDLDGLSRRDTTSFSRQSKRTRAIEYSSDIPNPMYWNDEFDSYFGFAVSSGYFDGTEKSKLLYVASAPRSNLQQGAVYIFDIIDHYSASDKTIKIYHTFPGQQFGEYFGYSLLTEDFDNDGLTDIAIGAPYNSKVGTYENGAVYIYKNEGTSSNFVLHATLRSDYEFSGRFGTTLSKVGDINQDGFNDLIVAAPFEGNGAIYIYHGNSNGLPTKATQRIAAPHNSFLSKQMFGHGLSKGADIDGNHYLDIAVGAPNSETVYIYKSYPVLRINATITPYSQEIQTNDKSFKFNVCWQYESKYPINFDVQFNGTVKLDGQLGRATFKDNTNAYELNGKITSKEQCVPLEAFVTFSIADIFRPIEIKMTHNILNDIPKDDKSTSKTQTFCETCVAINPDDSKSIKNKVVFSTGCKTARCVADLGITASLDDVPSLPYILGSSTSIAITFNVKNTGETAYLARIRIILPEISVHFTKTPSNCRLDLSFPNVMECDIARGQPMNRDTKESIKIGIDTTRLDGKELIVKANVFSAGDELNELDNSVESVISLKEFSSIEVISDSLKKHVKIQNEVERENLTHIFEIYNNGPSNIKSLDILILLPVSHINPETSNRETLIDINSVSIESAHEGKIYDVEWTFNGTILTLDATELLSASSDAPAELKSDVQFGVSKIELERKRRSIGIGSGHKGQYNHYLQRIEETDKTTSTNVSASAWNDMSLIAGRTERDEFEFNDRTLADLPSNRTMHLNCSGGEQEFCLQGRFSVANFKANDFPITIKLNFTMALKNITKIMTENKDFLVVRTSVEITKTTDENISTISVTRNQPFTIISKYVVATTPLWVYIISIFVGILSLIFISYGLYRFGFFNRGTRDNLVKLKSQTELKSYWIVPGDGGDYEEGEAMIN